MYFAEVSLDSALAVFRLTAAGQEHDIGCKLSLLTPATYRVFPVVSKNRQTPHGERAAVNIEPAHYAHTSECVCAYKAEK